MGHRAAPSCVSCFRLILSNTSQCTVYCWFTLQLPKAGKMVFSFHAQVKVYIYSSNPASGKAFSVSHSKGTVMNFLWFSLPGKFFTSSSLKYKCPVYRNLGGFFLHTVFHSGLLLSIEVRVEPLLEILIIFWGDLYTDKSINGNMKYLGISSHSIFSKLWGFFHLDIFILFVKSLFMALFPLAHGHFLLEFTTSHICI